MLQLEDARARILREMPLLGNERVLVREANKRFAAEDIFSPLDLPSFDNSAMDGYAVRSEDLRTTSVEKPVTLRIRSRLAAGELSSIKIGAGECARIFTGSALPPGVDAVVMQEDTREAADTVLIFEAVRPWENVRLRGEDVKRGDALLRTGNQIGVGRISLLSAVGVAEVCVGKRPVVGLLATGDELLEGGEVISPGKIFESNRAGLSVLVAAAGGIPRLYPIVRDDLDATVSALRRAFEECDTVVTSGGVSVGEFDFVKAAFQKLGGHLDFWRVAIKPGKPFVFGRLGQRSFFGLPGNPVSALVTFHLLVRPALLKLQGADPADARSFAALAGEAFRNLGERRHFVRVKLNEGRIFSAGTQASHVLSGMAEADGLLDLAPGAAISEGQMVSVQRWDD
jgi:molybdopterin molybdotransferase